MVKVIDTGKKKLCDILDSMVRKKLDLSTFWLEAIQGYINEENDLKYVEVPVGSWMEIDFHQDLLDGKRNLATLLDLYLMRELSVEQADFLV